MSRENPQSQGSATVSEAMEGWSKGLSDWMELTRGVEEGQREPRDPGRPGLLVWGPAS